MLTRQGIKLQTELTSRGREKDMQNAPLVLLPSVNQCRSGAVTPKGALTGIMIEDFCPRSLLFYLYFSRPEGRQFWRFQ